jgi:hypothetical protein
MFQKWNTLEGAVREQGLRGYPTAANAFGQQLMPKKIQCATHGDSATTYVCTHLTGGTSGLGFNRNEPTDKNPFPDAWCDDCELIRTAHGGWNRKSEKLASISMLCSGCYERARIRNERRG